jgi:hypothetical protein
MIRKPVRQGMALALLLCLPWLTACTSMSVSKSPVVDGAFGESVRQARARQLVNPDAGATGIRWRVWTRKPGAV